MLVSVVIPTYNRNDLLLGRALRSVQSQTYRRLEIIVVADGMEGPPLAELQERLEASGDRRIRFFNNPRQAYPDEPTARWAVLGLNARNRGLDVATGDWIAPLDDDDEWTPDHLEVLLAAAQNGKADFAYGISEYHWPDGHPQRAGKWPPGYGALCDGSQVYRNGLGYRYDPRCVERGLPEDGDLWNRMVEGGVRFVFVPRVVLHYWVNPR